MLSKLFGMTILTILSNFHIACVGRANMRSIMQYTKAAEMARIIANLPEKKEVKGR